MAVDVRSLYSVPPAEFVVARTALVKALKAGGRKDEAAAVQQLRRPRLAEHGLNLAARTDPSTVARWAAAVTELDAAQATAIGGGGAAALRESAGTLRDAHAAVLKLAVAALGDSGEAQRADVNDTLRSLAHPEGVPLLTAGIVGSEQLGDFVLFAGAPEPVVNRERIGSASTTGRTKPVPHAAGPDASSPTPANPTNPPAAKIDLKRLRALERAAAAARTEVTAADAALSAAREAAAAAKAAVAAATERAATARAAAREADAALTALRTPGAP